MGIILLPFIIVAFGLTSVLFVKVIKYLKQEKSYKVLIYGFFISCIELSLLFIYWKFQHKIYVLNPSVEFLSYIIIIPSIFSLLLLMGKEATHKAFIIFSSSVFISIFLLLFHTFISSHFIHIFGLLNVQTYH